MTETCEYCGDAAAYLLGALEPTEAERFRQHADSCVECRDELTSLRQVVDVLPLTAAQHRAPRALRRRVLRGVHAESALAARSAPRRRLFGPGLAAPRPVLAGALAGIVALAVVGGIELAGGGPSAPRVVHASVSGVSGSAQLQITGGHAELVVSHLPPPPPGHIYEVWIKRGNHPPAPTNALFSVTASGSAEVGVPGSLHGASAIMVTPEPAGGSLVPTHAPVIVARLA
jgi:hypothetical protein